ncbi:DUF4112 domain-containing protein [Affinirhizobium pseudoryzae]|uniref:DUF4112 domain-containing protein n=2 Tax=Allorhizobium pseudoryzae TaxID=379684 RepID=UPI0013ECCF84
MTVAAQDGFQGRINPKSTLDAAAMRRLATLARVARLMDTALRIPGTRIRFGADSIMGLLPGIGDAAGALVGLAVLNEARKLGLPGNKQMQMLGNLATDAVFGSVPVLGDLFDVYFKSHRRNIQIILDHFELTHEDLNGR